MENMERRRQRQNLTRHEEALLYILLYILLSVPSHNHRTVLGQVNHELPSRFEHLIIQKLIDACNRVSNVTKLENFKLTWESRPWLRTFNARTDTQSRRIWDLYSQDHCLSRLIK
jgi:hypothetical protein